MTKIAQNDCPICKDWAMRCEIETECPICGAPGVKEEIDALARQWLEEWFHRHEDFRVFGTTIPNETIH